MKLATYQLAKVVGGYSHYAEITIGSQSVLHSSSVDLSLNVFAWLKDDYGPNAWEWSMCDTYRDAAITGAWHALNNRQDTDNEQFCIIITQIHVHPAHSTWDSVAFASCFAVWDALGAVGTNLPYWKDCNIVLPDGTSFQS